jgi:hypothetical protein
MLRTLTSRSRLLASPPLQQLVGNLGLDALSGGSALQVREAAKRCSLSAAAAAAAGQATRVTTGGSVVLTKHRFQSVCIISSAPKW